MCTIKSAKQQGGGMMELNEELRIFLSDIPGGVLTYYADATETLDFISKGVLDLFGYDNEEEFRTATGNCFRGMVHPEDLEYVEEEIRSQSALSGNDTVEYRIITKNGQIRWVEDRGRLVKRDNKAWFYVVLLDNTEKKSLQQSIIHKDELYSAVSSLASDVLFDVDAERCSIDIYGESEENHRVMDVMLEKIRKSGRFRMEKPVINFHDTNQVPYDKEEFEINVGKNGEDYWVRCQTAVVHSKEGKPYRIIGRVLDNNEQKQRELKYRRKSQIDGLTGIYNRSAAKKAISRLLEDGACRNGCMLLSIDVDDFKNVNDRYGHPLGDKVLVYLADKMKAFFRENDIYARFGGDEFIVFLPNAKSKDRTWQRVEAFTATFREGREVIRWGNETIAIKISVGGVYCSDGRETVENLYQAADAALYKAKFSGKNKIFLLEI